MSISPVVRRARRFQDLLAIPGGDGPFLFTSMFRESDWRERRRSRKKFRLLKRVDGAVRELVEPEERVLFLTDGRGLSFWERWVLGWRRAVVLTDRRMILLQLDAGRRPRLLHRHVAYEAVQGVENGGWRRLRIALRSGETVELRGMSRHDRAYVVDRLRPGRASGRPAAPTAGLPTPTGTLATPTGRWATSTGGLESLCPYCYRAVPGRPRSCPTCLRDFRKGWLAAALSFLIPGLGNCRMGYRSFAVLEFLAVASVWSAYFLGGDAWGIPDLRSVLEPAWIFLAVHGIDALLTWSVARRGVYPA